MEFSLKLVPCLPDELVLVAEKPLSGVKFLEEAGKCLRRNLDNGARTRHQTIGNLASYTISVPQQLAIESQWFEDKSCRYLSVEHALLNKYIFHAASFTYGSANRSYYPYYQGEIVLTSYIDELAFLESWRNRGYPDKMTDKMENGVNFPLVDNAEDVTADAEIGDCVFDDLTR